MHCSHNPILYALSRLHQNRFIAIGCKYGIDLLTNSCVYAKEVAWRVFARQWLCKTFYFYFDVFYMYCIFHCLLLIA